MKKSIFIIASLAAVVLLSSFVIARNVTNNKTENPVTVSANDGWEYYKTVTVYTVSSSGYRSKLECYVWKKAVCGDPDYVLSESKSKLECETAISKNYYYGKDQDWTSEYKYVASLSTCYTNPSAKGYFNTYLQGWD